MLGGLEETHKGQQSAMRPARHHYCGHSLYVCRRLGRPVRFNGDVSLLYRAAETMTSTRLVVIATVVVATTLAQQLRQPEHFKIGFLAPWNGFLGSWQGRSLRELSSTSRTTRGQKYLAFGFKKAWP